MREDEQKSKIKVRFTLQDNIKRSNIRIIGVPEEEDKKKDHKKIVRRQYLKTSLKWGRK